ncbi:hypothetical protein ABWH92_14345 [Ahrensia marina]|uniref:hypothetical protein n=1 Tax=Ahrensia marina TaxID=1514904 RepID=UPI0035CF5FCD
MIDTWMNMWTDGLSKDPQTVVTGWTAMQDAVPSVTDGDMPMWLTSMATPVMAPAMMGAVAANTAVATWAGLWMGAPLAGAAALQALSGEAPAAASKKAVSRPAKPASSTVVKAATKPSAKVSVSKKATKANAPKASPKVDDRPAGLDAPNAGKADDLKRISGVGPKMESVLNDLGIYHFDQVAAWTKKEIAWVENYLRFKGRIERDGWIAQAKTFAKEAV